MSDRLADVERAILETRARLADLETAARVLRELESLPSATPADIAALDRPASDPAAQPGDLAGVTILVAATKVLQQHRGTALHYKTIAEQAAARGYRSTNPKATPQIVSAAFRRAMHKRTDLFEFHQDGKYGLVTK